MTPETLMASIEGAKRVWNIILQKAVLDPMTRVYTVRFTPEEMEAITSMSKRL